MRILARDVATFVARKHGMTLDGLRAPCRRLHIARPRQIAMHCIRRLCPHMSYPEIARLLNLRDHTTVIYGAKKAAELALVHHEVANVIADTLHHFRQPDEIATIAQAVQFQALCNGYSQAMRAAA